MVTGCAETGPRIAGTLGDSFLKDSRVYLLTINIQGFGSFAMRAEICVLLNEGTLREQYAWCLVFLDYFVLPQVPCNSLKLRFRLHSIPSALTIFSDSWRSCDLSCNPFGPGQR
jgi:hypothetical protein